RLVEAGRRFPDLVLKGAYMEGRVLRAADAQRLATLESREAMLAKIAGLAKAEMSRTAGMLQHLQGRFLSLLGAYRDKLSARDATTTTEDRAEERATGTPSEAPEADPSGETEEE